MNSDLLDIKVANVIKGECRYNIKKMNSNTFLFFWNLNYNKRVS